MFKIQFHKNNENNELFKKLKFIFTLLITPISPCTKILSDTYTITTSLKCKISKNVEKHRAIVFKQFKWKMEILSKNRYFKYNSNQVICVRNSINNRESHRQNFSKFSKTNPAHSRFMGSKRVEFSRDPSLSPIRQR